MSPVDAGSRPEGEGMRGWARAKAGAPGPAHGAEHLTEVLMCRVLGACELAGWVEMRVAPNM